MKILHATIRNVLGITELEMNPGNVTVIKGRNGRGKSSAMKSIQSAIGGGASLAELKNIHSDEKPEIVLHLESEEGTEYIVKKTAKSTSVKKQVGESSAFEDVKPPQRFLDTLYDGRLYNPMVFLTANEKDRVDLMLDAIDLPFDMEALVESMGLDAEDVPPVGDGVHPLAAIAFIRGVVFEKRKGVNRDERQKRASSDQLLREVPRKTDDVEGLEEKEAQLEGMVAAKAESLAKANAAYSKERSEAVVEADTEINGHRSEFKLIEEKIRREAEEKIAAAKSEMQDKIDARSAALSEKLSQLEGTNAATIKAIDESAADIDRIREEVGVLRERGEQLEKYKTLKTQARIFESDADDLKELSQRLSRALDVIDEYKAQMCSELPIEGLEINGKEVLVNGIPWDQLNTAQQIEIAVKIAVLRSRDQKLKIVMVDGAEALDDESFGYLREHLEKEGVQAFVGMVSNCDLVVE
jgi:DNA repair exonuclease SbcCD ATPase subunit